MTVGFRVKSGYAIAVVLDGTLAQPYAIARTTIELSDASIPETRQPHHDGRGVEMDDRREIARRTNIIERCARRSVDNFLAATGRAAADRPPQHAALVVGSVIDPASVGNPHIRAHAYEGQLFRTVLEQALGARGIACDVIVEKQLAAQAVTALARSDAQIKNVMAKLGKALGSPWRTDEKAAATAAWMLLR
jgi:hypothetical protein